MHQGRRSQKDRTFCALSMRIPFLVLCDMDESPKIWTKDKAKRWGCPQHADPLPRFVVLCDMDESPKIWTKDKAKRWGLLKRCAGGLTFQNWHPFKMTYEEVARNGS
ncbi:hypothetical protein COCNU_scaffold000566G000060 [Cocos nucifera]|nr:hypothetical protein [Cocos nucifera]